MPMTLNCVIRADVPAKEEGKLPDRKDIGRVVWMDENNDAYWWIPAEEVVEKADPNYPKNPKRRTRHFMKAPRLGCISEAHAAEANGRMAFVTWTAPKIFSLNEEAMEANVHAPTERSRRDLLITLAKWREKWNLIEAIVKPTPRADLFDRQILQTLIEAQRVKLGLKENVRIVRALREFLYWGGQKNALIPKFYRINVRGKPKLARVKADGTYDKPGRENKDTVEGKKGVQGYVLREHDRVHLGVGWKKFKTSKAISVEKAYDLTMQMYYCASTEDLGDGRVKVILLPEHQRPTVHQFQRHGPANDPANSAERINLGFRKHEMTKRGLKMKAIARIVAAGTHGYIDSTSCDQNLVRTGDRNAIISSPWITVVMERLTGYILGVHIGFEPPSTATSLMAIANSVSCKKQWCERYGVPYVESEWIFLPLKRVLHDHGELKSESGIKTLNRSEFTLQFARAYRGDDKGPVEAGHKSLAKESSHQMPGSTLGEMVERGKENPAKFACLTYREYVPQIIKAIIWRNNHAPINHEGYREEMLRAKVEPTRAGALKWLMSEGYIPTQQEDLSHIRAHCLPRLRAVVDLDGVHLFNPLAPQERVARLIYTSDALDASGLKEHARCKGVIEGEVLLNPSELERAWFVSGDELIEIGLATAEVDVELAEMTLIDVIKSNEQLAAMKRETKRRNFDIHVSNTVSNYRVGQTAMKKKRRQQKAEGSSPSLTKQLANKRESTQAEAHDEQLRIFGALTTSPAPTAASNPLDAAAKSIRPQSQEINPLPRSTRTGHPSTRAASQAAVSSRRATMEKLRAERNATL